MTVEPSNKIPQNWDDEKYLSENPDVAKSVLSGKGFASGYHHYVLRGRFENRKSGWLESVTAGETVTRDCTDPWNYLEIGASREIIPCCNYDPLETPDLSQGVDLVRNSPSFRSLRASLLQGELTGACSKCHIRGLTPVSVFKRRITDLLGQETDSLLPAKLMNLRIDITTACNLRCVYCSVSHPGYSGKHMSREVFDEIYKIVRPEDKSMTVMLNGHGETSYHPEWVDFSRMIQSRCERVNIISNFAKHFDDDEIDVMARMRCIEISLDTVDDNLLKQLRRKVALGTILRNIHLVRARARQIGLETTWALSCGIFDKSIPGLEKLAWFAITAGFTSITFWNLVGSVTSESVIQVKPISELQGEEKESAIQHVRQAVQLLRTHGVRVSVAGDFIPQ